MCFLEFDIDIILGCFHPFLVGKNTKLLKIFEIILNFLRQIDIDNSALPWPLEVVNSNSTDLFYFENQRFFKSKQEKYKTLWLRFEAKEIQAGQVSH